MQQAADPSHARSRCTCNLIFNARLRPWSNILFNGTMYLTSAEGRITKLITQWVAQGDSVNTYVKVSLHGNDHSIYLCKSDFRHRYSAYKQFQFAFIACHLFYFLISILLKLMAKNTLLLKFRGFHNFTKLIAIYGF